jgi:hypothetical protein
LPRHVLPPAALNDSDCANLPGRAGSEVGRGISVFSAHAKPPNGAENRGRVPRDSDYRANDFLQPSPLTSLPANKAILTYLIDDSSRIL